MVKYQPQLMTVWLLKELSYLLIMVFCLAEFWVLFFPPQENDTLKEKIEGVDHSSQHEEDEEGVPAHLKSLQPSKKDENKMIDALDWEAEEITESRNEVSVAEASRLVICLS